MRIVRTDFGTVKRAALSNRGTIREVILIAEDLAEMAAYLHVDCLEHHHRVLKLAEDGLLLYAVEWPVYAGWFWEWYVIGFDEIRDDRACRAIFGREAILVELLPRGSRHEGWVGRGANHAVRLLRARWAALRRRTA